MIRPRIVFLLCCCICLFSLVGWRNIPDAALATVERETRVDSLLAFAKTVEGQRYNFGGCSIATGFDCSGFVHVTFGHFGIDPGRTSRDQAVAGRSVVLAEAQRGDIIVFARGNDGRVFHSGIVVEASADSLVFMHATASKGVHATTLQTSDYWKNKVRDVRRLDL